MAKRYLSLSVHQLVDFLLRAGDIDNRVYNQETMQLGSKIHAAFQKKQGNSYLSEYPLKETFDLPEASVTLEGRADGIIVGEPMPILDEIKSTILPLKEFFEEQSQWHLGQAKCYALMYCHEKKIEEIGVRLTYISQIDESRMVKDFTFTVSELEKDILGLIDGYLRFFDGVFAHQAARDKSCASLPFPFLGFRAGQREMAKYAYSVASGGGTFFCEAPTGIGKTVSALYPAVKAFAKGKNEKIFYLTAKTSGQESAYSAVGDLLKAGLVAKDSTIVAKDKICFTPNGSCNPDECPFAKGYYSKLRSVLLEAFSSGKRFDVFYVASLAKLHGMCPFELQLDLTNFADIIICDYNYLFDPLVHLERYFDPEADSSRYVVLVDEAHNLVERGRDMYSVRLESRDMKQARLSVSRIPEAKLKRAFTKIKKVFVDYADGVQEGATNKPISDDLVKSLENFRRINQDFSKNHHDKTKGRYKDFSMAVNRFLFLYADMDPSTIFYVEKHAGEIDLNLYCLDPSAKLRASLEKVKGRILFSATLSPIDYYMDSICGDHGYPFLLLPTPFPAKNFDLMLAPKVSIRYKDRKETYEKVASYIEAFIGEKSGNYFVYLPSYEYLDIIKEKLCFSDADVYVQEHEMRDADKTVFLSHFERNPQKTSVGLLVIGGTFSEGIDLVDDRLIGVVVVGIGIPQICHERDLIKDYYDKIGKDGFEYAYINPGMNRVMQAVGRLIRSETDKGAALLIDDRYMRDEYRALFNRSWEGYQVVTSIDDVRENLRSFYSLGKK